MGEKEKAYLVERGHSAIHGGQYEIWDVGDWGGIYVDFNTRPAVTGEPETMAFSYDLRRQTVTDWNELGVWLGDATGGEAIRDLGYEPATLALGDSFGED